MAEELNMHFSSVFTREDTSSLPVPETKFNGSEEEKLGQLIVTPEVVANKINNDKVGPLEDNAGDKTRGKILVHYLYQKQSSMDQRRKSWGS